MKDAQEYTENQKKMVGPIIDINQVIGSIKHTEEIAVKKNETKSNKKGKAGE